MRHRKHVLLLSREYELHLMISLANEIFTIAPLSPRWVGSHLPVRGSRTGPLSFSILAFISSFCVVEADFTPCLICTSALKGTFPRRMASMASFSVSKENDWVAGAVAAV